MNILLCSYEFGKTSEDLIFSVGKLLFSNNHKLDEAKTIALKRLTIGVDFRIMNEICFGHSDPYKIFLVDIMSCLRKGFSHRLSSMFYFH